MPEPVEIKFNIEGDIGAALDALQVEKSKQRDIYFAEGTAAGDAPGLPLLTGGVIVRLRQIHGGRGDSTIKLRPCLTGQLPSLLKKSRDLVGAELKVEKDWSGGNKPVRSASCAAKLDAGRVDDVIAGHLPLSGLFVEAQLDFLREGARIPVELDDLRLLGPISATSWDKTTLEDVVAERWTIGPYDFLELSTRADSMHAARQERRRLKKALTELGVSLSTTRENKTSSVLTYLAGSQHRLAASRA